MPAHSLWRCAAVALALLFACSGARAQDRLDTELREQILRVPARVQDPFGKEVQGDLLVTTFRPQGAGPFPLVVISHGRDSKTRAEYKRQRYESAARFFVRKGFAVAVPLRLGYGELAALGDPESSVNCASPRFAPALAAAAEQILTVARFMQQQPGIDPQRLVLVGVSVGGIATIAAASLHQPQALAAINFAGGHGGRPDVQPGEPCQAEQLRRLYGHYGALDAKEARPTRTLWVYAENDRYFSPANARRWAEAYGQAGAEAELHVLPPFGEDGHKLFGTGNDVWQGLVDQFLAPLGFDKPGALVVPPASGVALDDESALPIPGPKLREGYEKFLAAKLPRAFAISSVGRWGYATGDDAVSRALAFCQRDHDKPCKLYAVNETVVWSKP
ncbi:hypothetical protein J7U46_07200 [Pelomonas sp. V22]|uniref:alpha/beta hydrolase family protein n=1 Tax=Pelomonas sp. V22 TaxID=2822139 RepID=UPI0024A9181D|nr:hypothetical protein [Pelomonas sp. V22]MDI4632830.1 hypothetical protein [Pelomonas sp. V22]